MKNLWGSFGIPGSESLRTVLGLAVLVAGGITQMPDMFSPQVVDVAQKAIAILAALGLTINPKPVKSVKK